MDSPHGDVLQGGFQTPAIDAAHAFRAIMEAMSRPGLIKTVTGALPPAPLSVAAGVALLTLCDHDTPLYLAGTHNQSQIREWIAFHTGAPVTGADSCLFALGTWESLQPLRDYSPGTAEYPDRSATLIVEVDELSGVGATLTGPGIKGTALLSLPEIDAFKNNYRQYPLGLDFLFTTNNRLAALPRSTEVG